MDKRLETVTEHHADLRKILRRLAGKKVKVSVVVHLKCRIVSGEAPSVFVADGVNRVHQTLDILLLFGIYKCQQSRSTKPTATGAVIVLINRAISRVLEHTEFAVGQSGNRLSAVLLPKSKKLLADSPKAFLLPNLPPKFRIKRPWQKFHVIISCCI